jgi:hypothetical protein
MHATDLNEFSRCGGSPLQPPQPQNKKPDCTVMQSGIRQEWRGKTGHVASIRAYGARRAKVSPGCRNMAKEIDRTWQACKCCTAQLSRFTYIG